MKRKWLLNMFISILALLTIAGCMNDDNRDGDNIPFDENNDRHLEENFRNDDGDRNFDGNQENDSNFRNDRNSFDDQPEDNTNMP